MTSTGHFTSAYGWVNTNSNPPGGSFFISGDLDLSGYDINNASDITSLGDISAVNIKTSTIEERSDINNIIDVRSTMTDTVRYEVINGSGVPLNLTPTTLIQSVIDVVINAPSSIVWPDFSAIDGAIDKTTASNKYSGFTTTIINNTATDFPTMVAGVDHVFNTGVATPLASGMSRTYLSIIGAVTYQTLLISECPADANGVYTALGGLKTNHIESTTGGGTVEIEGVDLRAQGTEVLMSLGDILATPPTNNSKLSIQAKEDTIVVFSADSDGAGAGGDSLIQLQNAGQEIAGSFEIDGVTQELGIYAQVENARASNDIVFYTGGKYTPPPSVGDVVARGGTEALRVKGSDSHVQVSDTLEFTGAIQIEGSAVSNTDIVLGRNASSSGGGGSTVLGVNSSSALGSSVVIGDSAQGLSGFSLAIGTAASSATSGVSIGRDSAASGNSSTAIGRLSLASSTSASALGHSSQGTAAGATALGYLSTASVLSSTACGREATASGNQSLALAFQSLASHTDSIAIGSNASSTAINAISIGLRSEADHQDSIALGTDSMALGSIRSIAIGESALCAATYRNQTSIGRQAECSGADNMALGFLAKATGAQRCIMLGVNQTNSLSDSIKLVDETYSGDYNGTLKYQSNEQNWSILGGLTSSVNYSRHVISTSLTAEQVINGYISSANLAGVSNFTWPSFADLKTYIEQYQNPSKAITPGVSRHTSFRTTFYTLGTQEISFTLGTNQAEISNSLKNVPALRCVEFVSILTDVDYETVRVSISDNS